MVRSRRVRDGARLHAALTQLAEQDPLINFRQHARSGQLTVSLYGEVQKEVIEATLSQDYRIPVAFEESTTICIERVRGTGAAVEFITDEANPFLATVGLRVEPGPLGSGASFGLETYLHGTLPLAFVEGGRGSGVRNRPAGAAGLGGDGLSDHDDAFGLLPAAEPRPRHLRQVDVQRGR